MACTQDFNFCYPLDLSKLQTGKLRLVPFDSHLPLFAHQYVSHTSTPLAVANFRYLPYGPFHTVADFFAWYNKIIQPSKAVVWFAILVSCAGAKEALRQRRDAGVEVTELDDGLKVNLKGNVDGEVGNGEGKGEEFFFAGSIGLLNAAAENAVCEIGHINILPWCQRTFVTTLANALLLHYLLDSPSESGLALRRVTWLANARNERSVKAAQRLGFRMEGIMRWHRILPEGKDGEKVEGDGRGPGRDTAMLSICWDDWRDGVRGRVLALVERRS